MRGVAIYARISQDRTGESVGVDRQLEECRAHAKQQGWTVVAEYVDNDKSAMSGRRPEFERMLGDLGSIDVIVVWSADRLYRRLADLERLVDVLGTTKVDALHSGEINLASADGRSIARILGSLAQRESEKMGERVSASYQQRAMAGGWSGGPRRLGYNTDCTELVQHEADLIAWAYRHIDSGGSVNSVARRWEAEGMTGPLGGTIQSSGVRNTLLRPRNAGLAIYRGEIVGETTSPPIIDRDTWTRVTAKLRANKGPGRTETTMLSGIAVCGECGGPVRAMVRHYKGKTPVPAYRCAEKQCASRRRDQLDNFVAEAVITAMDKHGDRFIQAMLPAPVADPVADLRSELDALARMLADGQLSAVAYAAAEKAITEKINSATKVPASTSGAEAVAMLTATNVRDSWEAASIPVRRQVVRALVDKIVVPRSPGEVRIEWAA